jgi:guanylate kinase
MNKPLYCFVGKSASGKTTVANELEVYGFTQLWSYCTRPKRYEFETGHTFISEEEFSKLENIIAYTEYNGHKYCATKEQIDTADIYVIDVSGIETLLDKYKSDRPIVIFYFDTSVRTRIERMMNRHDSDMAIVSRLYNDEEYDWYEQLSNIVAKYNNIKLHKINANQDFDTVVETMHELMSSEMR